jgi:hypothetical protein
VWCVRRIQHFIYLMFMLCIFIRNLAIYYFNILKRRYCKTDLYYNYEMQNDITVVAVLHAIINNVNFCN